MAKVKVIESASSSDDRAFRIRCTVTEGEVLPGMVLSVPLNSSISVRARVDAAVFEADQVVLTVRYQDQHESILWGGLNIGDGDLLEVTHAADSAAG